MKIYIFQNVNFISPQCDTGILSDTLREEILIAGINKIIGAVHEQLLQFNV